MRTMATVHQSEAKTANVKQAALMAAIEAGHEPS